METAQLFARIVARQFQEPEAEITINLSVEDLGVHDVWLDCPLRELHKLQSQEML